MQNGTKKRKTYVAQTAHLALFGPVLVIVYYPIPLKHKQSLFIIVSSYIHKGQKKTYLGPKRCVDTADDNVGTSIIETNFGVLFQEFITKLHLRKAKS